MDKQCLSLFCRLLVILIIRSGEYVSSAFFGEARRVASRSSLANDKILKATKNCYSAVRTKRSLSAEDDPSCIETESMQVMCSGKMNPSDGSKAFCLGRALSTTPRKSCPLSAFLPSSSLCSSSCLFQVDFIMSSASLSWFSHPSHADMMLESTPISRPPPAACRPKPTDDSLPVATLLLGPMSTTIVLRSTPPRLARSSAQAKIRPYRTATFCRDMIDIAQTNENK